MAEATIRCWEEDLRSARQICERVLEAESDRVARILFHGSRVSGRPRGTSDFDILVVVRDPVDDWVADSLRLSELFNDFPWPVDVQVFGETEFNASVSVPGTLAYPAYTRGVVLYEQR
ncbi:MAG TPA: nucleotidyltransferase domain-containing protein [Longimicrobium sp.]|jgi:predicted nucleotidyltransferase